MTMEQIGLRLKGSNLLMVNNPQTVNPFNTFTKQIKELTGKKRRTDQDEHDLMRIKWRAALYYDEDVGPYLPSVQVLESIRSAAKISRQGLTIGRGLHTLGDKTPILYRGPRDPDLMYEDERFVDIRDASPSGKRVTAVRPVFRDWAIEVNFLLDPEHLNRRDLLAFADLAGKVIGIGTYRKIFGRYECSEIPNGHGNGKAKGSKG